MNLTTNGFNPQLISRKVSEILELKVPLLFVNVSLDGPAEIHDTIRGVKSYSNAIKTLTELRELQKQYDNFQYGIEYTLSPFNTGKLQELISDLNSRGLISNCTFTIFHTGGLYHNINDSVKQLDIKKALEDIKICQRYRSENILAYVLKRIYLYYSKYFLVHGKAPISCVALKNSLFIDPYGNVHPCIMLSENIMHYRDLTREFFKKAVRLWKNKYKDCKKCWTPCEAYTSIMRRYFLLGWTK